MSFGDVALAGGFLESPQHERKYPLTLCFCESCFALQIKEKVDSETLFRNYFYFTSTNQTIKNHFTSYIDEVAERFKPKRVIEFGCNDGFILSKLADKGIEAIGVDPARNVIESIEDVRVSTVNDFFNERIAERLDQVDMVIANNVFAHIPDIHGTTKAVKKVLKDDGVFVFEVHYIGDMIEKLQYDWIYHEHLYYYSLLCLESHFAKYGMTVFDVKHSEIHGGSMRYYVCKDDRTVSKHVLDLRQKEIISCLNKVETFEKFAKRVLRHASDFRDRVNSLTGRVVGYGASGRANALIQYCDLELDYMVDDAPAKQGKYTPGSHIKIYPRSVMKNDRPDHIVVFAWTFLDEIRKKCEGHIITPFEEPCFH